MEENYQKSEKAVVNDDSLKVTLKKAFAEFIASILFIFSSCGAAIATQSFQTVGAVTIDIALAFGFSLVALCFAIGHISGGHLNSVVTLSCVLSSKMTAKRGIFYFIAHMLGGIVGAALLRFVSPSSWAVGCMAANRITSTVSYGQAFLLELILTFFLIMVVHAALDSTKSNQVLVPLSIGLCVTVCHFIAIPMTGCSLNPTRSFASAIVASGMDGCGDVWKGHWIFWIACPLGGILATLLYENVFLDPEYAKKSVVKDMGRVVTAVLPFLDFHATPTSNNGGRKTDLSSIDAPASSAGHARFEDEE